MIFAEHTDKSLVTNILATSFSNDKSVNYIVKQDKKGEHRLMKLMEYSFEV